MDQALHQLRARRRARWGAGAILGLMSMPIILGFGVTILAAFGFAPVFDRQSFALDAFATLFVTPGFGRALGLSIGTGVVSTYLALAMALGIMAGRDQPPRFIAPVLAAPHAAIAIGFAFIIAPTGLIARLLAWPLGWELPPNWQSISDPYGLAIIGGLVIKELPFFLLVLYAARNQIPAGTQQRLARSLGYSPARAFFKIELPQLLPLIRWPFFAVLAFALSNVDMALILGPSNPPTFAVATLRAYNDPDLSQFFIASAGAAVIALVIILAMLIAVSVERAVIVLIANRAARGLRAHASPIMEVLAQIGRLAMIIGVGSLFAILVWSFAFRWPFPRLWPESLSFYGWRQNGGLCAAIWNTVLIALVANCGALVLVIGWLHAEQYWPSLSRRLGGAVVYVPLIAPQISFLFGMNLVFLRFGLDNGLGAVIWAHMIFVFPYLMLGLSAPWRALDARYFQVAKSMGVGALRQLWTIRLPLLAGNIATALAIGIAVSVAQYLPTLFMGGGRINSLTTEAVALAAGGDRRISGAYASMQAMLPLCAYLMAIGFARYRRYRLGLD